MHWFVRAALHSIFLWSHVDHIWVSMMMKINIFFPALWHMIVSVIYRQSYCQMDRIMSMFRSVNWLIWTMDFTGTTKHVLFLEPWLGLFHLRKHCQPGSLQWRVPREEATKVTSLYSKLHVSIYGTRYFSVLGSHIFFSYWDSTTLLFIFWK